MTEPIIPEVKQEVTPPASSEPAKEVPSTDVKPTPNDGEVVKFKEQVENLNVALRQEREEKRAQIESLTTQLKKQADITEKLKGVFTPAPDAPMTPAYLTAEQAEAMIVQKQKELLDKQLQNQKIAEYQKEISTLEKEWDGQEGKPKYDDSQVLEWQKANGKTYLSPSDAFFQMKQDEIINFRVKQTIAKGNPVSNVETPSATPGTHTPGQAPAPKTELELRQAVKEAMEAANKEM